MIAICTTCDGAATAQCARRQAQLCDEHTVAGQPVIMARQLVSAIATTAVRAPGLLGDILFKELDQVGYCATCREQVAVQRVAEQQKLLGGILLVLVLVAGLLIFALT